MGNKYFMWYDSSRNEPTMGPHYFGDEQTIGKNFYHTSDELLKMKIPDSLKKRIVGAKVGTKIKIHYLHSCGNLMVKRIDENQFELLKKYCELTKDEAKLQKNVFKIRDEKEKINQELFEVVSGW